MVGTFPSSVCTTAVYIMCRPKISNLARQQLQLYISSDLVCTFTVHQNMIATGFFLRESLAFLSMVHLRIFWKASYAATATVGCNWKMWRDCKHVESGSSAYQFDTKRSLMAQSVPLDAKSCLSRDIYHWFRFLAHHRQTPLFSQEIHHTFSKPLLRQ